MRSDPARMLSPACDGTAANAIASISFKSASCIAAAAIAHWLRRGALAPRGTLLQTATKQMVRPPLRSFDNAAARFRAVLSHVSRPVFSRRLPCVDSKEIQSRELLARRSDRQLIHLMRFPPDCF